MIKQGHLGAIELFILLTFYNSILYFYSVPSALGNRVSTGAWLLNIALLPASCLLLLPLCLLLKRFPGKSVLEIGEGLVGSPGRLIVMSLIAGFYMYANALYASTLASAIGTTILLRTPLAADLGLIIVVGSIISYLGLEALSRAAMIFSPFILLGFIFIIALVLPDVDMSGMYPILGAPIQEHMKAAIELAPIVHEGMVVGILAPYIRQGRSISGILFWSLLTITFISTFMVLVIELSFPFPGFETIPYPLLQVAKMIHIGRFIERVEALFLIMAIVLILIHFSLTFHTGVLCMAQGLKLSDWRPLIFPWMIISYSLSFLPQSGRDIAAFGYSIYNSLIFLSVSTGIPILLYVIALIRRKKGGITNDQQAN